MTDVDTDAELWRSEFVLQLVRLALAEDCVDSDITSRLTIGEAVRGKSSVVAEEPAVVCGLPLVELLLREAELGLELTLCSEEGAFVQEGKELLRLSGKARELMAIERVTLNFLQRLSGIATYARKVAGMAQGLQVYDTRKTTPGWRVLEKYAVRTGGANNHRMNLSDMVLIKDNHIDAGRNDISTTLREVAKQKPPEIPVEIEVRDLDEVRVALEAPCDYMMLDNMNDDQVREALTLINSVKDPPQVEVSGDVTPNRFASLAALGITRVSMGALTTRAHAVNLSMDMVTQEPT